MQTPRRAAPLCLAIALTACGNHLTRSAARRLIDSSLQSHNVRLDRQDVLPILIQYGTVSGACEDDESLKNFDEVESNAEYDALADLGYLTKTQIQPHVWKVDLTDRGKSSISGEPYAHRQGKGCEEWQVNMPMAKFVGLDISQILEDGVHAKVDVILTYAFTPLGLALRPVADKYEFEENKKKYGEQLAETFGRSSGGFGMHALGDSELRSLPDGANEYKKTATILFSRYDDGWKVDDR